MTGRGSRENRSVWEMAGVGWGGPGCILARQLGMKYQAGQKWDRRKSKRDGQENLETEPNAAGVGVGQQRMSGTGTPGNGTPTSTTLWAQLLRGACWD